MRKILVIIVLTLVSTSCKNDDWEELSYLEAGIPSTFRSSILWYDMFEDDNAYSAVFLINYCKIDSLIEPELELRTGLEESFFFGRFDSEESENSVDSIKLNEMLYNFTIRPEENILPDIIQEDSSYKWDISINGQSLNNSISLPNGFENLRLEKAKYTSNDEIVLLWDNPDDDMIGIKVTTESFYNNSDRIQDGSGTNPIEINNSGTFRINLPEEFDFNSIDPDRTYIIFTLSKQKIEEITDDDLNIYLFGINYTHQLLLEIERQ